MKDYKRFLKTAAAILVLAGLAAVTVVGCQNSKSSSNGGTYCDAYGRCYNPSYGYGYGAGTSPYYNIVATNPNAIYLRGGITVTNGERYQKYLKGIGVCSTVIFDNACSEGHINAPPGVEIVLQDYKFSGQQGTTPGTVQMNMFTGIAGYTDMLFRATSSPIEGFDTAVYGPPGSKSFDKPLGVVVQGRPTDSSVQVFLSYNGTEFGRGTLYRQNRGYAPGQQPVVNPLGNGPMGTANYYNKMNPYYGGMGPFSRGR